jgi:hypothetical protein
MCLSQEWNLIQDAESAIADEDKPNEKPAAKPKPSSNVLDA